MSAFDDLIAELLQYRYSIKPQNVIVRIETLIAGLQSIIGSGGPPTGPAGGDLGGNYPNPTVLATHLTNPLPIAQGGTARADGLAAPILEIEDEGVPLTTAPTSLDFAGAGVTVTNVGGDCLITIPGAGAPTGPAAGDLGGNYPNPTVLATHLTAPLPIAQGGTARSDGRAITILQIKDEGVLLTGAPDSVDFVGAGVVASNVAGAVTITISGNPVGAAAGDLGGTYPGPTVVATHLAAPLPLLQGGTANTTGNPSGAAGGDLGGTYPNPQVTNTHLAAPLPVNQGGTGSTTGVTSGITIGVQVPSRGRITLASGIPAMTVGVNSSTIFFTPYNGNQILLWDGTSFVPTAFPELSQTLADATKSPAASVANKNYDMFVWSDAGILRCTRGPAWTSDTVRSAAVARVQGILVNTPAITNGPGAGAGTYVGTIRTGADNVCHFIPGGTGSLGGDNSGIGIWNQYNQIKVRIKNIDSTSTWTYATPLVYRAKNNSLGNQIFFVHGFNENAVEARNTAVGTANAGGALEQSIGLDAAAFTAGGDATGVRMPTAGFAINRADSLVSHYMGYPPIGYHVLIPIETGQTGGIWIGNESAGSATALSMIQLEIMA
jgi:hypothetical protein